MSASRCLLAGLLLAMLAGGSLAQEPAVPVTREPAVTAAQEPAVPVDAGVGVAPEDAALATNDSTSGDTTRGSSGARLVVRITGLEPASGQVAVALYDSEQAYETGAAPLRRGSVTVGPDGVTEWPVEGLAPGVYAVAVYLDRNGNGELDRNRLGIPKEPYGFSNDARGAFGPPTFGAARFSLDAAGTSIEITLR